MLKRIFDITFSLLGLLMLPLPFLIIAISIKLEDRGPLFYKGVRMGKNGRHFMMLKFRTMKVEGDKIGATSTPDDDPRLTRIGKILRRYKLDELPQLINILIGDMSFVGPRPQVSWAVQLYTEKERKILLSVRPGITDYASVRFSNEGDILKDSKDPDKDYMEKIHPEKMRLSMEYAKNMSLRTDIDILLKTFLCILRKEG